MRSKAFLEEISVDGLGGRSALTGGDDHLAIGRCETSGCVEPLHGRFQIRINDDLTDASSAAPAFLAKPLWQTSPRLVNTASATSPSPCSHVTARRCPLVINPANPFLTNHDAVFVDHAV